VYWQQLSRLLEQDPKNYMFRFEQIDRLMQEGRSDEASRILEDLTAQMQTDGEMFWLVELGVICVSEKLFPFCFKLVEMMRLKARKDQMWQADLLESRTHLASGTIDEAVRYLDNAIKAAPGARAEIENMKAIIQRKHGDFAAAAKHYREALRLAPEDHRIAFNIGLCHEHTGETAAALEAYKMALSLSPTYARAQSKVDELESRRDRAGG
jgi:tetratricopeptide (TPR) repeat protein